MLKLFVFTILSFATVAQSQPAEITFFTERSVKRASGTLEYEPDKQATVFTPTGNVAPIYLFVEYKDIPAIKAKYRLDLQVAKKTAEGEEYAYNHETYVPKKPGKINIRSNFTEGDYIARLVDNDNENDVYATATFKVGAATVPDYKNNSTFVACTSVDDDWNAVGETKTIKAGSCIQFLYKASRSLPPITHYFGVWAIRKVGADGSEEYVNDLLQTAGDDPWRFLATDNVCNFSTPGKYRVYLASKSTIDALHGVVGDEYFGKMELTVK